MFLFCSIDSPNHYRPWRPSLWISSKLNSAVFHSSVRLWDFDFKLQCKMYFHLKNAYNMIVHTCYKNFLWKHPYTTSITSVGSQKYTDLHPPALRHKVESPFTALSCFTLLLLLDARHRQQFSFTIHEKVRAVIPILKHTKDTSRGLHELLFMPSGSPYSSSWNVYTSSKKKPHR